MQLRSIGLLHLCVTPIKLVNEQDVNDVTLYCNQWCNIDGTVFQDVDVESGSRMLTNSMAVRSWYLGDVAPA